MADRCVVLSSDDSSNDSFYQLTTEQNTKRAFSSDSSPDSSPSDYHQLYKATKQYAKKASSSDSSPDSSSSDSHHLHKSKQNAKRVAHFLSDSESSDSSSNSPNEWPVDTYGLDSFPMELENEQHDERDIPSRKTASAKGSRSRPQSKEERAAMKEIKMREKLEKNATREKLRQMKPGECIKSMKVIMDSNIFAYPYLFQSIENALQEFGADLTVQQQPIRNSITWSRSGSAFTDREDSENDAIIIWSSKTFSSVVCNDELSYAIQTIKERLPNKRVTLLIYSGSDIDMESEGIVPSLDSVNAYGARRKKATTLNKKRLEIELVRLQFEHDCSYRLIEARVEVGKFLAQFTKAISEIPFRKEKERQEQELAWLAAADSRGCVRVNKSSHGLAQLWTQQLLQFNNCNLDAANEITKRYPTPQALVKAYERCASEQEAATLLKEIPIVRKCIGDLAARRKLGPELSRKLHLLFTCKDPNVQLSNE